RGPTVSAAGSSINSPTRRPDRCMIASDEAPTGSGRCWRCSPIPAPGSWSSTSSPTSELEWCTEMWADDADEKAIFAAVDRFLDDVAAKRLEETLAAFSGDPDCTLVGSEAGEQAV